MSKAQSFQEQMAALQAAYVKQLPHKVRQIEDLWRIVCGGARDKDTLELLYYLVHKLNGSGPTFGFTAITERAERLEQVVKELIVREETLSAEERTLGDRAMSSLRLIAEAAVSDLSGYASLESKGESWDGSDGKSHGKDALILVVDDEAFLRKKLVLILREAGYRVAEAEDGMTALMQARMERPDLVLMDYIMPVMDGIEAISRMRQDEQLQNLPVLLMTTVQKVQDVQRALDCNVQGYVAKPFDATQVIEQVNACLSGCDGQTGLPMPAQPKKHILIADDYVLYRKKIALTLKEAGFDVEEADNGVMALKQAREHRPDLILMDVMMPLMDGLEATQHIRSDATLNQVPVIVLTTKIKMKDVPVALAVGADAYIAKPQSAEKLIEKVKTCLAVN